MGFTPFFMVYGSKAILPTNLEYGAPRVKAFDEQGNQTSLKDTVDQLEEARERCPTPLCQVLADPVIIPCPPHLGSGIQRQGLSTSAQAKQQGLAQIDPTMEGPICRRRSTLTRHRQAGHRRRQDLYQCLEHRAATSLLPLDFQAVYMLNLERIKRALAVLYFVQL
jgi:hypothetical protein